MDARRFAPAAARNREPICEVLARVVALFPRPPRVLEIASGSGEHAMFCAERLPSASWQPTDPDPGARASIEAWRAHLGPAASRVLPAIEIDVEKTPWPVAEADIVVCINMIHIAPWSACEALVRGASGVLGERGVLYTYGPYKRGGVHTAPSNEAFDASLRSRDARWGVRDLEALTGEAERHGLELREIVAMPANNLSVVLSRARIAA